MNVKPVLKSLNKYKAHAISSIKILNHYKNSRIAIAAALGCIVLSFVFIQISGVEVYSLTIGGKDAGYVTEKSLVDKAIKDVLADYSTGKNEIDISIDENAISCKRTDLKKNDITALTVKDLKKIITASDICTAKGWAINVDGKNIVALKSDKSAKQILVDIKNHYLTSGSKVISSAFKENVMITQSAVQLTEFMTPDEAKSFILTGEKAPKIYTVKDGDTLWDIAAANRMSTTELQSANPGFDPDKLKIGQQLNLFTVQPYITIETKELITATEKIDFNTVYEETNTLYKGEIKIKTAGTYGSKQVSSEVRKENGVIIEAKVIESIVTAEPQNQVALKGMKSGTYIASRGGGRSLSVDASGSEIVAYAKKFIGTPYRHGGASPDGFDCSGFTQYVFAHFGGNLPRTAAGQFNCGTFVEKSELEPGDLVFFKSSSRISHVGIYVGGGSFIHAPQSGDDVKTSSFSTTSLKYYGAARASN